MDQNKLKWIGRVLTGLLVPLFLMGIVMMATKNPQAVEGLVKYGWPASAVNTVLALETLSLILLLIPRTAVFGAVMMTAYLGGAVATHLRAGESPAMAVIVGVIVWVGLWLREPRLRALAPFRRLD